MNDISTLSDKFSWRRMMSVGLMYKSGIRMYLLLAVAVSVVCFCIVEVAIQLGGNTLGVYTVMSSIVSLVLYLSPLVFARRDDTLMALLPAKPIEKWLFYILFSIVVVPALIQSIWYGAEFIVKVTGLSDSFSSIMLAKFDLKYNMFKGHDKVYIYMSSFIQTAVITVTVLYSVLGKANHRMTRGVLSFFGALIVCAVVSGIIGMVLAIVMLVRNPGLEETPIELIQNMLPILGIIDGIFAIYVIVMLRLSYRRIAKEEVKA